MEPIWKFSHKIKCACTCHPNWRSSKIISLHFINIRKQKFLILHIHSLCLCPSSNRSSLPNVRGQESEWHECITCEGNTQYNMNLSKWMEKPSLLRGFGPWCSCLQSADFLWFHVPPGSSFQLYHWSMNSKFYIVCGLRGSQICLLFDELCTQLERGKVDRIPFPHPLQLFVRVILVEKILTTAGHWEIILIKMNLPLTSLFFNNNQLWISFFLFWINN